LKNIGTTKPFLDNIFTLENIYDLASDDCLGDIVHSIIGRLWDQQDSMFDTIFHDDIQQTTKIYKPTDKELHKLVLGLRTPQ